MPEEHTTTLRNKVISIDAARLRLAQKAAQKAATPAPVKPKEWTRQETLALGQQRCSTCFGLGVRQSRQGQQVPCGCVFRAIFNTCLRRYHLCAAGDINSGQVSYDRTGSHGVKPRSTYSMKNAEYMADFLLVAFRTLNGGKTKSQLSDEGVPSSQRWRLFTIHFLMGADWRRCCLRLQVDRGVFYHEVYRVAEMLGKAFAEVQPFSLFPIDEYFTANFGGHRTRRAPTPISSAPVPQTSPEREIAMAA